MNIHYRTIAGLQVAFVPQDAYEIICKLHEEFAGPPMTRKTLIDAGYMTIKFGTGNVTWYTDESDIPPLPEEPESEPASEE